MNNELNNLVHDLCNKLTILHFKTEKVINSMPPTEETKKVTDNTIICLDLIVKIKKVVIEQQNNAKGA